MTFHHDVVVWDVSYVPVAFGFPTERDSLHTPLPYMLNAVCVRYSFLLSCRACKPVTYT